MFATGKLNQVIDLTDYHHVDITIENLSGRTKTRAVRFKLFNEKGEVGLEFRRLEDWPTAFRNWPGSQRDAYGHFFKVYGQANFDLSMLVERDILMLTDLVSDMKAIVEHLCGNVANKEPYLSDATALVSALKTGLEENSPEQDTSHSDAAVVALDKTKLQTSKLFLPTDKPAIYARKSGQGEAKFLDTSVSNLPKKPPKIIINAVGYVGQSGGAGGAGVFLRYLIEKLAERHSVDVLIAPGSANFGRNLRFARFIEMPYLTGETLSHLRDGPTVVVDPFGALPCLPFPDDMALCIVIHDLMHLEKPYFFRESERTDRSQSFGKGLQRADAVITFSADQARAIRRFYPGSMPVVIPHLPYAALKGELVQAEDVSVWEPFLLFPAVKWPHKNHRTVIEAFGTYARITGSKLRLILCGGPCAESRFSYYPSQQLISEQIIDLGHIDETLLQSLLKSAQAILFPTLYEGFGIPVLEAAYSGKMVVATKLAVFDEILGQEGYYAVDNSLCELRWMAAFASAESDIRLDYEAKSRKLSGKLDINRFIDKFSQVLKVASDRYIEPSLYPVRGFPNADRTTSEVQGLLSFVDIYGSAKQEKGSRYPVIGKTAATQSSVIFNSVDSSSQKVCLRAEYSLLDDASPTSPNFFSAWLRLRANSELNSLSWSVNDGFVIDLLPKLKDGDWHLVRREVPKSGFIDFRATRAGIHEVGGYELEIHNPALLLCPPMPLPIPDDSDQGLTIFVDALSEASTLAGALSSIQTVTEGLVRSAARLQWVILIRHSALEIGNLPGLPAAVRVQTIDPTGFTREHATRLVSPYQPLDKILLLQADDLHECLAQENLDALTFAAGISWSSASSELSLARTTPSFWLNDERGHIISVRQRTGMPIPVLDREVIESCLAVRAAKALPRFAVIETDLIGGISHHSTVTGLFLDGAKDCGFEPILGLNASAKPSEDDEFQGWSGFSPQVYQPGTADQFTTDLTNFVKASRLGPQDVIFMHSLSPQILLGAARFVAANPDRSPIFAMRFFSTAEAMGGHKLSYVQILKSILSARTIRQKMHFFCESENLITYYEEATGERFPLLLNPEHPALTRVRHSAWYDPGLGGGRNPTLAYFGEARAEKGFDYIPGIVEALLANPAMAHYHFLIQVGSNTLNQTPEMARARAELAALKAKHRHRLRTFESAETPEEFYFLMKHATGVISPYRPDSYGKRGTGVTLEALQMGLDVFAFTDTDLYATFAHTGHMIGIAPGQEFAQVVAAHYRSPDQPDRPGVEGLRQPPAQVCKRLLSLCQSPPPSHPPAPPILWVGNDTFGEGCSAVYSAQKSALQSIGRDCFELFVPWPDRNWRGVDANAYDAIIYGFTTHYEGKGLAWVARPNFGPQLDKLLDEVEASGPTYALLRDINRHMQVPPSLKTALAAQGATQTLLNYVHLQPIIEGWMPPETVVCETHDIVSYQHAVRRGTGINPLEKIDEFSGMAQFPTIVAISAAERAEIAGACPASTVFWRLPPYVPEPVPQGPPPYETGTPAAAEGSALAAVRLANPELQGAAARRTLFQRVADTAAIDMVLIGSGHPANIASFDWFITRVFLPILAPYGYNLFIAGSACAALEKHAHPGLVLLGRCTSIEPLLRASSTCPLPVIAGSGAPIKTIPALAVNGAISVTEHIDKAFALAEYGIPSFSDPKAFGNDVLGLLEDDGLREDRVLASRRYVEDQLSVVGYNEFWRVILEQRADQ